MTLKKSFRTKAGDFLENLLIGVLLFTAGSISYVLWLK